MKRMVIFVNMMALACVSAIISMPALADGITEPELVATYSPPPAESTDWRSIDYGLLASAEISLALDWGQTKQISRMGRDPHTAIVEVNPILGANPSLSAVNRYFGAAMIGTAIAANLMPERYRRYFLGGVAAVELVQVGNNRGLGLRIGF